MTDQEKRKRFWKILITIVVLWFVVVPIILAAALALIHYHHQTGRPATRIVPNLIGLDSQSAQDKARDAGFLMTVMGRDWNLPDSPCTLGRITKQEPRGGESVQFEQIGVVTCVEDPDEKFWKEQRKRSSAQPNVGLGIK